MKFSACIEMLYQELPFLKRLEAAQNDGFTAVEFWTWENKDMEAIAEEAQRLGLEIGIFQGNTSGRMIDPKDYDLYVSGVERSIAMAQKVGCRHLFLMTDILKEDRTVEPTPYPLSPEEKQAAILNCLRSLARIAAETGITLLIEPLNTHIDHKGYYLEHSAPAFALVREINSPNIKVLYDVYHMQIMEGNLINTIKDNIDLIGYIHIADVPGRFEPGTGEINYINVLAAIKEAGYQGIIGFEFQPTGETSTIIKKVKSLIGYP